MQAIIGAWIGSAALQSLIQAVYDFRATLNQR